MNFVLIGSFWPARRSASLASGSGTPASSNITRPGLITATQPSGEPLPLPIRVSAGFFVNGLSGKMLIHTLPPRLILRVIAIRAASIWRLVNQPSSSALIPKSPNCTLAWPFVSPRRRPRWCLRNFVFFGSSMVPSGLCLVARRVELGRVLGLLLARRRRLRRIRDGGRRGLDDRLDHRLLAALGADALVRRARLLDVLVRAGRATAIAG